jgi:hypothetical protein
MSAPLESVVAPARGRPARVVPLRLLVLSRRASHLTASAAPLASVVTAQLTRAAAEGPRERRRGSSRAPSPRELTRAKVVCSHPPPAALRWSAMTASHRPPSAGAPAAARQPPHIGR